MIVLFVCTGNTCRSPMAEGILKSIAKEKKKLGLEVKSAGISVFDGDHASRNSHRGYEENRNRYIEASQRQFIEI